MTATETTEITAAGDPFVAVPHKDDCFCFAGYVTLTLEGKTARKSMKRFPVGAPTTKRLISFCQREEEAPRQTASTQVVSIRLCSRGT